MMRDVFTGNAIDFRDGTDGSSVQYYNPTGRRSGQSEQIFILDVSWYKSGRMTDS